MLDTMGDRLQYARKQKNLTQQKVCDSVDIEKVQTLSAYERDKNNPPIPILEKLCNLYQVSVDWIIRGKEFEKTITTNAELIETLLDCAKRLGLDKSEAKRS